MENKYRVGGQGRPSPKVRGGSSFESSPLEKAKSANAKNLGRNASNEAGSQSSNVASKNAGSANAGIETGAKTAGTQNSSGFESANTNASQNATANAGAVNKPGATASQKGSSIGTYTAPNKTSSYKIRGGERNASSYSRVVNNGESAKDMATKRSLSENPAIKARTSKTRGDSVSDSLVSDAVPKGKERGDAKSNLSKSSKARVRHASPKSVTSSAKDAVNGAKNAKNAKSGKAKQAAKEAKKAIKDVAKEVRNRDNHQAHSKEEANQQAEQKKKKKTAGKIASAPLTVPLKVGAALAVAPIALIAIFAVIAGGIVIIVSMLGSFFSSLKIDEVDIKGALVGDLNYAQYIVDHTHEVLGDGFENACENSVYAYYTAQDPIPSADETGKSLEIPWYCSVSEGQIDNIWMWEESDNITLDDSGKSAFRELEYWGDAEEDDVLKDLHYKKDPGERKQLGGISANLEPILSAAHYRYDGEWDFDNYQTVMAYVYAMYVNSHDLAMFDSNAGATDYHQAFHYEYGAVHTLDQLYGKDKSGAIKSVTYDPATEILTRPVPTGDCDNVFVHDFTTSGSTQWGKDHPAFAKFVNACVSAFNILAEITSGGDGEATIKTGFQELPYTVGDIDVAVSVNDLEDGNPLKPYVDGKVCSCGVMYFRKGDDEDDTTCGLKEHTHTPDCYVCNIEEHTHTDDCYDDELDCKHVCSEESGCIKVTKDSKTGKEVKVTKCVHKHTSDCYAKSSTPSCGKEEHSHAVLTQDAIDAMVSAGNPDGDITVGDCTYTLNCGETYHKHQDWSSNEHPGCWQTVAVCPGHCGGHIDPYIDVCEMYSFQGLAMCDPGNLNATWMSATDFKDNKAPLEWIFESVDDDKYKMVSTEEYPEDVLGMLANFFKHGKATGRSWKKDWTAQIRNWYSPGPNSPASLGNFLVEEAFSTVADTTTTVTNFLGSCWNKVTGNGWTFDSQKELQRLMKRSGDLAQNLGITITVPEGSTYEQVVGMLDQFQEWPGWYVATDDYNYLVLDVDMVSELSSIYGVPQDDYQDGTELWEEFEVQFPLGGVSKLSRAEIEAVMDAIEEVYGDEFNEGRKKVVEEALTECGWFTYPSKPDYASHVNGMTRTSGFSECTGFVSGVLYRALGPSESPDSNGCGYHWAGRSGSMGIADRRFTVVNPGWCEGGWDSSNWNNARPSGEVYTSGLYVEDGGDPVKDAIARPGDVVTAAAGAPRNTVGGHAMIYLGYYEDPLHPGEGPKHHTVECYGGAGSDYTHHNQYDKLVNNYNAIFRPHDYGN